ncbi:MAG: GAF domain-containing protein [Chloroflexi bacterium]|nr:GAF domain-containing protein [Chloroflexota bacterium]
MLLSQAHRGQAMLQTVRRLRSWMATEQGALAGIWFLRLLATLGLTALMVAEHNEGVAHPARPLLLVLFLYLVASGAGGVYFSEAWLRWPVKLGQALVEIMLFSACIALLPPIGAPLSLLYALPLFSAIRFLPSGLAGLLVCLAVGALVWATGVREAAPTVGAAFGAALPDIGALLMVVLLVIFAGRRSLRVGDFSDENDLLGAMFKRYEQGAFVVDANRQLQFVNDALRTRHGTLRPGTLCSDYFSCSSPPCPGCAVAAVAPSTPPPPPYTTRFIDQNGQSYAVQASGYRLSPDRDSGSLIFIQDMRSIRHDLHAAVPVLFVDWLQMLSNLSQVSQDLASSGDYNQVLDLVVRQTQDWFQAESAAIFTLEDGRLVRQRVSGLTDEAFAESYAPGEGVTGLALLAPPGSRFGQPIRASALDDNPLVRREYLDAYRRRLRSGKLKHLLAVPLNGKDGTFGVLRVVNKLDGRGQVREEGFSECDEEYLKTIATMIARALEHTRLLRASQDHLREISLFYRIYHASAQSPSGEAVAQVIVEAVLGAIPAARKCEVRLIDEQRGTFSAHAVSRRHEGSGDDRPLALDEGVAGRAIRLRQVQVVPDTRTDQDFVHRRTEIRSLVVAPIISHDEAVGILSVDSLSPHSFTSDNVRLLEALATHAALALGQNRLYRRAEMLRELATAMTASLDEHDVYERIVAGLKQVIGYDNVSIQLLEPSVQQLRIVFADGFPEPARVLGLGFPTDDPAFPNSEVIRTRDPLVIHDVGQRYPHFVQQAERYQSAGIRSLLCLPLIHDHEVIGMIALGKGVPDFYTPERVSIAASIAGTGAIALANARAMRESKQREQALLTLVTGSSILIGRQRPEELYKFYVQVGAEVFNVAACALYRWDEVRGPDLVALVDQRNGQTVEAGLAGREALVEQVVRSGKPIYVRGPALRPPVDGRPAPNGAAHEAGAPLLAGPIRDARGLVIGALMLQNPHGDTGSGTFSPFHEELLSTFAAQLVPPLMTIEERQRARQSLSDDLHDMMNLVQGALVQRAAYIRARLPGEGLADVQSELQDLQRAGKYVYQGLRRVLEDVRDPVVQEQGLVAALEQYGRMCLGAVPLQVAAPEQLNLPADITYALYRIGQEALHNIKKHAGLTPSEGAVTIRITQAHSRYRLQIEDNGVGFVPEETLRRADSYGLTSIERWCELIQARSRIYRRREGGMCVCVEGTIREDTVWQSGSGYSSPTITCRSARD